MSKSKAKEDGKVPDISTKGYRTWKQTMDGCGVSVNPTMLDPQYAIPRTWSRSSRLMKSGTHELKNMKQSEVIHTSPTLGVLPSSCTFLYACMHAVFGMIPGHAPALPPPTWVSMKWKSREELHHTPSSESPYFPSSSLCTSMPFLALWRYQDLHAGIK